jgi:hypothetical protein
MKVDIMADLDDLMSQIPVADIANQLGAPEAEVNQAIHTLVPTLVGGVQHNVVSDDIDSSELESAIATGGGAGQGEQMVARIFGGNDTNQVASALAGSGAGSGDLIKRLLPILIPIVLAYLGKQSAGGSPAGGTSGGGLGDVLGSILGGASSGSGGGDNPLGSILGNVLGGKQGGAIGDILGGLLGGKK